MSLQRQEYICELQRRGYVYVWITETGVYKSYRDGSEGMCGLQRRGYIRVTEMGVCVSYRDEGMCGLQRQEHNYNYASYRDEGMYGLQRRGYI